MASGLVALLDDVAAIAKLAATTLDDVTAAAGKAGAKAAGVVIDDTAVTPRYVVGLTPDRELPIIGKIALGSMRNKLLILLPAALLLSAFAPWAITPLLMAGGAFLCFEATEKVIEALAHSDHTVEEIAGIDDPKELEERQVGGAIRTDFILSAEIMAIALGQIPEQSLTMQGIILAAVAIAITIGVYGVVALIVKMDDVGLHMAQRKLASTRAVGRALVAGMPPLLSALSVIGTAAMVWVGGGIIVHGLDHYGLKMIPQLVHGVEHWAAGLIPAAPAIAGWLGMALASAVVGLAVGAVIVALLHLKPKRKAA